MDIPIVYAHPEPGSSNAAMKEVAVDTLRGAGHGMTVSDLYAMRFEAALGPRDFPGERAGPDVLSIPGEQTRAYDTGTLAEGIAAEQEKIRRADLLILRSPVWWFGMPAVMQGWADRVSAGGSAYVAGRKYDTGPLRGRTAMIAATTGTSADTYAPDGIDGDLLSVLWPIHDGLLRYCGFDVLAPFNAYMPGRLERAARRGCLEDCRNRLLRIDGLPRLFFHPAEDHGPNERLGPGVAARSGVQRNVDPPRPDDG